jgi:hypothetical protein
MAEQAFATELERHGTSGRATHGASGRRAEGLPRYRHHELHGVLRAVPAAERPQQPRAGRPGRSGPAGHHRHRTAAAPRLGQAPANGRQRLHADRAGRRGSPRRSAPAEHPQTRADGSGSMNEPTEMELVVCGHSGSCRSPGRAT